MLKSFFTNRSGKVVLGERPNIPIIIWLVATLLKAIINSTSALYRYIDSVGFIAIVIWALMEILQGNSPFRRVLGGVVLGITIYSRAS